MKKIFYTPIFALLLALPIISVKAQDAVQYSQPTQNVINEVDINLMWSQLKNFQTLERYTTNQYAEETANYLKSILEQMDFDTVYFQRYNLSESEYVAPNIIAVKNGTKRADSTYVVGAHWDSYASMAPACDDNGTGTGAVLEAGRILSNYSFERTIMFCLFSGNQFGLSGSKEFVGSLTSNNKIGNIINLDMIGYQDPEVSFNVGVFPTPNKFDFYDNFQKIQSLYVPKIELRSDATYKQANSDINNFWDNGFEGISLSESYLPGYNENPYKNTENDLLTTSVNSPEKWELTTKLAIASLITYAKLVNTSGIAENESFVNEVNNYPNPFNGTTHINFQISKSSNISLFIYDIYGNEVKRIKENEFMTSGNYSIEFDASEIASGIYFYQIKTETNQISKKMIIN